MSGADPMIGAIDYYHFCWEKFAAWLTMLARVSYGSGLQKWRTVSLGDSTSHTVSKLLCVVLVN